jgi:hypothetical protein
VTNDTDKAKRLWGWSSWEQGAKHAVPQLVFGELVKLAAPRLERFQSDLYHDAMWLHRELPLRFSGDHEDAVVFHYAVSDYGTSIGTEADYVRLRVASGGGLQWRITVSNRGGGAWFFQAEEVTP